MLMTMLCLMLGAGPVHAENQSKASFPGPLPEPVSNNAVAEFTLDGVQYLMSFMGLGVSSEATMDHRGLLAIGDTGFATVGGMTGWQIVTPKTVVVPRQALQIKETID